MNSEKLAIRWSEYRCKECGRPYGEILKHDCPRDRDMLDAVVEARREELVRASLAAEMPC